jgi:hypothetical protein
LFGFHFLLFMALRLAPPIEANLVNYLWPLLIVLLTPLVLPGYAQRRRGRGDRRLRGSGAASARRRSIDARSRWDYSPPARRSWALIRC